MSEQRVEDSLVTNFWSKVSRLTELSAWYSYYMAMRNAAIQNAEDDGNTLATDDPDNMQLKGVLQELHMVIHNTYIGYRTISAATNKKIQLTKEELELYPNFESLKSSLSNSYVLNSEKLEDYVLILNRFVALEVAANTLKTTTDKTIESYSKALGGTNGKRDI